MNSSQPTRKRVVAKPVSSEDRGGSKREVYAEVCYYYPQYRLTDVEKLPARDVKLLLKTARKIEAGRMYNLVQIAAAPHSKKGKGVEQLSKYFKEIIGK